MKKSYIGIDIGGTKISGAVVDNSGKIFSRGKFATPPDATPQAILKIVKALIHDLLMEAELSKKEISGIGIGVPGVVSPEQNKILITPNIRLSGFPLAKHLKKTFPTTIIVGNDVNLGLLGEHWLGAAKDVANVVSLFLGTGVGGAFLQNGKLVTGTQGLAAEIGHMIIDLNGPLCSCGNKGCLEAHVGRWAIERDIRQAIHRGEMPRLDELTGKGLRTIKSKILKKALKKHDPVVTKIMRRVARILGKSCISLSHIVNPELFILGGGVMEACGSVLLPEIEKNFRADPFFKKWQKSKITLAKLGDDAVILGAVALVRIKT